MKSCLGYENSPEDPLNLVSEVLRNVSSSHPKPGEIVRVEKGLKSIQDHTFEFGVKSGLAASCL